ncbi:MAG TPA: type II secretion system protein GspL [Usitatibacter sp.]|nr:type II secretion system protein GspL [Usitatibacter sp.]
MRLRVFLPSADRPDASAAWPWMLFDSRRELLREERSPPSGMPRADDVEIVLPAARVLFARLRLPRVGAATLRELLPYAVEDRLLADPSRIQAIAGPVDARGETLVAVIDREWLRGMVEALQAAGIQPARAWCESALAPSAAGEWHLVLGPARGMLVDDLGAGVAFDRDAGGAFPLALRIALDEASARGDRPRAVRVHGEGDASAPELARWSAEAGVALETGSRWEALARGAPASGAIDLLGPELAARSRRLAALRVPRAALVLAAAIAVVQLALDGAQTWRLARERSALHAKAESIFRATFPEARAVVDPRLQMERNLADLRRTRGLAAGDDFLAQLTRAARAADRPASAIEYANGRLEVRTGGAPIAEAKR